MVAFFLENPDMTFAETIPTIYFRSKTWRGGALSIRGVQTLWSGPTFPITMQQETTSKNDVSSCDPRLSRAAREILRVHLARAWKIAGRTASAPERYRRLDASEWNVWQLLDDTLAVDADVDACPLFPDRDIGKYYEEQSIEIDGLSSITKTERQGAIPGSMVKEAKPRKVNPVFHQCGICHKNFTSQFYLDRHFELKHNNGAPHPDAVCPAQAWCNNFLSHNFCHDVALELEPYYGPGSAGYGADRHAVHRKLVHEAHNSRPCAAADLEAVQAACHGMVRACFAPDSVIGQQLNQTLCVRHTCHGRLHQLLLGGGGRSILHPNDYYWHNHDEDHHNHRLGVAGFAILVAVVCFYAYRFIESQQQGADNGARRSREAVGKVKLPPTEPPTTHAKQH